MTTSTMINVQSISLGSASSSSTKHNVNYAICKSLQATSVQTKCSLQSSLVNFKFLNSISLDTPFQFNAIANMHLHVDMEYTVPAALLPKHFDRTIHIEGKGYFVLNSNSVIESNLLSPNIPNNNNLEALIPPSSCFNLTLSESITTVVIPFTAQGMLLDETTGTEIMSTSLAGTMSAVVLDTDYSEIAPC